MNRAIVQSDSDEEVNLVDSDEEEFKQPLDLSDGQKAGYGRLVRPKNDICKPGTTYDFGLEDSSDSGGEDEENRDGLFGISSKDKRKRALDRLIQTKTEEDRRHRRASFQNTRSKYIISDDENEEAEGAITEEPGGAEKEDKTSSSIGDDGILRFPAKRKRKRNILENPESDKKVKRRSGGQIVLGERDYYSEASSGNGTVYELFQAQLINIRSRMYSMISNLFLIFSTCAHGVFWCADLSDFIASETDDDDDASDEQEKQDDAHSDGSDVEDPSVATSDDKDIIGDPKIIVSSDEEDVIFGRGRNRAHTKISMDSKDELAANKTPVSNRKGRLCKLKERQNEYKMDLREITKQNISPLERIKKAQQSIFENGMTHDMKQTSDSISLLTDEGEPDSSSDMSSSSLSDKNGKITNKGVRPDGVINLGVQSEPEAWERCASWLPFLRSRARYAITIYFLFFFNFVEK